MPTRFELLSSQLGSSKTLALDIGNSSIKGGLFRGTTLLNELHISTDPNVFNDATFAPLNPFLQKTNVLIGIASVVPEATTALTNYLQARHQPDPVHVHHAMRLPFQLGYTTPATLGVDRIAAAAGVWYAHRSPDAPKQPYISVDAGTAITYDVVDRHGTFLGGPIGAGPRLIQQMFRQGTAQLPHVPMEMPPFAVGRSTVSALQAGMMFGFIDSVRGMLNRIAHELGEKPQIVLTGGWCNLLTTHLSHIHAVDQQLVLKGILALTRDPALVALT